MRQSYSIDFLFKLILGSIILYYCFILIKLHAYLLTPYPENFVLKISVGKNFYNCKKLTLLSVDKNLAYDKTATETHSCTLGRLYFSVT